MPTPTTAANPPDAGPAPEPKPGPEPEPEPEPADDGPDRAVARAVEAIVLTSDRPVPASRIAEAMAAADPGLPGITPAQIDEAAEQLNAEYHTHGRAFRLERVAGGWRAMASADQARVLAAYHQTGRPAKLSRPALETLAIVAYKQPITRARLEAIRGVACGEVLRSLLERKLAAVVGRAEEVGRPMLYGTTRRFLDQFGLASLDDLPAVLSQTGLGPGEADTGTASCDTRDDATGDAPTPEHDGATPDAP